MGLSRIILRATKKFGDKIFYPIGIGFFTNYLFEKYKTLPSSLPETPSSTPLSLPETEVENKVLTQQIQGLKNDKNLLNGQLIDSNDTNQILLDQNRLLKELVANLRDENNNLSELVENSFEYKFQSLITNYKVFSANFLSEIPSRFTDLTMGGPVNTNINIHVNPYIWDAICQFFGLG